MMLRRNVTLALCAGLMVSMIGSISYATAQSLSGIARDSHKKVEDQLKHMDKSDFIPDANNELEGIAQEIFNQSREIATLEARQALAETEDTIVPEKELIYFVSFSMSKIDLASVINDASQHQGSVIVFRGLKDDSSMGVHGRALGEITKKIDQAKIPSITINPLLFDKYQVQVVPELIINEKDAIVRARGGLSASTLMQYVLDEPEREDFGVFGKTHDIEETHFVNLMKARMAKIDWKTQKDNAYKKYWEKDDRFVSLPQAEKTTRRVVPTQVEITSDITTKSGVLLTSAGERFDSAKRMPLSRWYIIFDARDDQQREFAKKATIKAEQAGKASSLLLTRFHHDQGWKEFTRLQIEMGQSLKVLNKAFIDRFEVRALPAIVRSEGDQIIIEEFYLEAS